MSAVRIAGVRKTVRQFSVAVVACMAVAGGAALVAAPDSASAPVSQQAGAENDWPKASPTPVAPTN
ncbi:hypothetical protein J7E93_26815 [Streptomyces sp. ISL-36]|uniref:hypothetical protein n=1 Tax=Streptomyces sp. ISL-36 TaxID=2819182 RepID=UPI001BE5FF2D|nr:hypothetical protein [Streptomyces sp. ISL-36]MBT2443643.1 hypothetical protein [Streptomyces sp. ISL-36]